MMQVDSVKRIMMGQVHPWRKRQEEEYCGADQLESMELVSIGVVCCLPCSERFSPGSLVFLPQQKLTPKSKCSVVRYGSYGANLRRL